MSPHYDAKLDVCFVLLWSKFKKFPSWPVKKDSLRTFNFQLPLNVINSCLPEKHQINRLRIILRKSLSKTAIIFAIFSSSGDRGFWNSKIVHTWAALWEILHNFAAPAGCVKRFRGPFGLCFLLFGKGFSTSIFEFENPVYGFAETQEWNLLQNSLLRLY